MLAPAAVRNRVAKRAEGATQSGKGFNDITWLAIAEAMAMTIALQAPAMGCSVIAQLVAATFAVTSCEQQGSPASGASGWRMGQSFVTP